MGFCIRESQMDESIYNIVAGPFDSEGQCVSGCCQVVCDPGQIYDSASCECVPPPDPPGPPDPPVPPPDPPVLECPPFVTVKGYAFYKSSRGETEVIAGQLLQSPCGGGHICNRAIFLPRLKLDGGVTVTASNPVNLNNAPCGGNCDRADQFTFQVPVPTDCCTTSSQNASVYLDCWLNNGLKTTGCHNNVTWVVLVGEDFNTGLDKVIFSACVAPGGSSLAAPLVIDFECPGSSSSSSSKSSSSSSSSSGASSSSSNLPPTPTPTPTRTPTPTPTRTPTPTPTPSSQCSPGEILCNGQCCDSGLYECDGTQCVTKLYFCN